MLSNSFRRKNMQALILWDARLLPKEQRDSTDPPVGNEVKRVDEFTDLASAIFWIGWKADQYAKNVSLIIMAHGNDTLRRSSFERVQQHTSRRDSKVAPGMGTCSATN
jgi:hypothetical protein